MTAMAFWSKSSEFDGWRKAHFVDGAWRTMVSPKTLDELNTRGDYWELVTVEEAIERFIRKNYQPVSEITEARFMDMLEVLPPLNWRGTADSQSFKLSEMYSGNITDIFAQYGTRYFQMRNHASLTHDEIIEKVKAFIYAEGIAA
ncbi:hypothetical protein KGP26_29365 (plasmid) [Serratia sp. JSRIV002]|uniref:DUF1419 domain-containing protein n=1 Tax=Serratia TaxID=613 RepID=UPI0016490A65|nr:MULTISPECIES: DUF1419 domain-containing protein [Serratia]MBC3252430.1 hypothetical protein [Serratia fonticola]UAN54670.1 hypothetical protein KGP26_29365 [Serratia sp. JSRIV002]